MTFEELNLSKSLQNALTDLGFERPTTIQEKIFSVVMSGKDVCGIAQTGTGKTLAYLLPYLQQYKYQKDKKVNLLIIVPTRELVTQVLATIKSLTKYMNVEAVGVYGGANIKINIAEIRNGLDILVATPGRLIDLLSNGTIKPKSIKKIVIDEFDEILELGFRAQINQILEKVSERNQFLLFSATFTEEAEKFVTLNFKNPVRVEAAPAGTPLENITQNLYEMPSFYAKIDLIKEFLKKPEFEKVIVFVATKTLADKVFEEISKEFEDEIGIIHSNKAQNFRFNSINSFQNGNLKALIATDLVARGIDISEVSHVINFDIPTTPEAYIHRIGRTGRVGKTGNAITLMLKSEKEKLESIEKYMNLKISEGILPENFEIGNYSVEIEIPEISTKTVKLKLKRSVDYGGAFHEKIDKNKKVNVRRNHMEEKMIKYGRKIKRSGKH
ncbi:MAG: DEAD/DEAH box helicase [Bacteroidota bacterium]